MAVCIFCRREGTSKEHVVPAGIGGRKTIDRVCTQCDSDFGTSVDAKLVDHPLVYFDRARLGIAGRSRVPNPLGRGTLANDPQVRVRNIDTADGIVSMIQTSVTRRKNGAGQEVVRVVGSNGQEVLEAANKVLERDGKPPLTLEELREHARVTNDRPEIVVEIKASTISFRPALVKIAYEVAWMTLGDAYLTDAIGEVVREALMDRDPKPEDLSKRLTARFWTGLRDDHTPRQPEKRCVFSTIIH